MTRPHLESKTSIMTTTTAGFSIQEATPSTYYTDQRPYKMALKPMTTVHTKKEKMVMTATDFAQSDAL